MLRRNHGVVRNLSREHVLLVVKEEQIPSGGRGRESVVFQTSTDALPIFDAAPRTSLGRLNGDRHTKKRRRLRQMEDLPSHFFQGLLHKQHEGVIRIVGKQKDAVEMTGSYRGVDGRKHG